MSTETMFTRKNIVAYTFLLTVVYQIRIGTGSAQSLRYLVGIHQTYQVGDPSVKLKWLLLPSSAAIYFLRCNHSSSFGEPTKGVFSNSNISSGQFSISGRWRSRPFEAALDRNSFNITIFNPQSQHQGWYFCEINTLLSTDITGALKLSRHIGHLTSVQANDGSFDTMQKSANLTWQYVSKDAAIKEITCLFRYADSNQWKEVALYNVVENEFKNFDPFRLRIGYDYEKQKGMFILQLRELGQQDQGQFSCEFVTEERKAPVSAKSKLVYVPGEGSTLQTPISVQTMNVRASAGLTDCTRWIILFAISSFLLFLVGIPTIYMVFKKCQSLRSSHKKPNEEVTYKVPKEVSSSTPLMQADNTDELPHGATGKQQGGHLTSGANDNNQGQHPTYTDKKEKVFSQPTLPQGSTKIVNGPNGKQKGEHLTSGANNNNQGQHPTYTDKKEKVFSQPTLPHGSTKIVTGSNVDNRAPCEGASPLLKREVNRDVMKTVGQLPSPLPDDQVDLKEKSKNQNPEKNALDTNGEMYRILNSLNLLELCPIFNAKNIQPSTLSRIGDVFFWDMGTETIGDIIHLRHYHELNKMKKKYVPDILRLLAEINCKGYASAFVSQKVDPDDFQFLTDEHFDMLGVKEEDRTTIRTTNRKCPEWIKCGKQVVKNLPAEEKPPEISVAFAGPPAAAPNEALAAGIICHRLDHGDTSIQPKNDSTETIGAKVDMQYKSVFGNPESDVQDFSEMGAVLLDNKEGLTVVCMVSGTDIYQHESSGGHNLLQNCFSRFLLEEIKSSQTLYIVRLTEGGYELKGDVKVCAYLSAPPCSPLCSQATEKRQQEKDSDCFQRIKEWKFLGFQGPLLSHLMRPIYISTLEVCGVCHDACLQSSINKETDKNIWQKMPPAFKNQTEMLVKFSGKEKKFIEPADKEYIKYWYKGKDNVTVVKAETGKSLGPSGENEIDLSALLRVFKEVLDVTSRRLEIQDDNLVLGSDAYQQAIKILREHGTN